MANNPYDTPESNLFAGDSKKIGKSGLLFKIGFYLLLAASFCTVYAVIDYSMFVYNMDDFLEFNDWEEVSKKADKFFLSLVYAYLAILPSTFLIIAGLFSKGSPPISQFIICLLCSLLLIILALFLLGYAPGTPKAVGIGMISGVTLLVGLLVRRKQFNSYTKAMER
ncbi:hypothetical protein KFE80_12145 [bacterium SCSIO 12696]|nr:hypothetical protein KFE80_12145 [bacterium SCSIO 12696]